MSARPHGAHDSWQSRAIERLKDAVFTGHGEARKQALADAKGMQPAPQILGYSTTIDGETIEMSSSDALRRKVDETDKEFREREVREIAAEEAGKFLELLPKFFADKLREMPVNLREQRAAAIRAKFAEWEYDSDTKIDYLRIADIDALSLAAKADATAAEYALKYPASKFTEPEHRKRRDEKWWLKRLKKEQGRVIRYLEAFTKAVGGPQRPDRPLYISDYMLDRHRDHKARTQEILRGSRQVKVAFPSTQIPMDELDELSKVAKAARMRLWIDMQIERWTQLDWHACWITVTLPGKYVPHATNESSRASEWDVRLGPDEAAAKLQQLHRQTLAILKKKKIRAHGWWNSQPQQSGVPHRHYVLAAPTLEQARAICDDFRKKFSTSTPDDDVAGGQDRGCQAYVIEDDDARYRPRKSKDGSDETMASVAKYAARYATRYETIGIDEADEGGGEIERFFAWAASRNARKHAWLGLDTQRAPAEIWDTLWKSWAEGWEPKEPRMKLALREIRRCQEFGGLAANTRAMGEQAATSDKKPNSTAAANSAAAFHAWHAAIAMGMWPDHTLADAELRWLRSEIASISEKSGLPPPDDALPPAPIKEEKESAYGEKRQSFVGTAPAIEKWRTRRKITLNDAGDIIKSVGREVLIEMKARPLEKWHYLQTIEDFLDLPADNRYTEKSEAELKAICDGWGLTVDPKYYEVSDLRLFLKSLKKEGFGFSKRPCGALAFYVPSDEILLKTKDEWEIMQAEPAQLLKEHHEMYLEHLKEQLEAMSDRERDDWSEEQRKQARRDAFEKSENGKNHFAEIAQICNGDTPIEGLEKFSLFKIDDDERLAKMEQVPLSPTDPRDGAAPHHMGWTEAADPPPI